MTPTKQAKSKATVARNQNSIRRLDGKKKNLGRTQAQSGASSPLANINIVSKQLYSKCISEKYI